MPALCSKCRLSRHRQHLPPLLQRAVHPPPLPAAGPVPAVLSTPASSVLSAVHQSRHLLLAGPAPVVLSIPADSVPNAVPKNPPEHLFISATNVAGSRRIHTIHQNSVRNVAILLMIMISGRTLYTGYQATAS